MKHLKFSVSLLQLISHTIHESVQHVIKDGMLTHPRVGGRGRAVQEIVQLS